MKQEKIVYEIPKMVIIGSEDGVLTEIIQRSNAGDISDTEGSKYDAFFKGF